MTTQQAKERLKRIETAENLLAGLTQKQRVDLCLYAVRHFYATVTVQTTNTAQIEVFVDRVDVYNSQTVYNELKVNMFRKIRKTMENIKKIATNKTTIVYKIALMAYDMSIAAIRLNEVVCKKHAEHVIYFALKFSDDKIIDDLVKVKEFLTTEETIQN